MSDYLSNLPVELIHKILDDITIFDILASLCLVNKRLRLISLGYPRFRLDLNYIKKKKQFDLFCDQLTSISSQIISLSCSDRNDASIPSKIERFFLRFEVINDTFSNLKSLHLSHVNLIMWESIKNYIKPLVLLSIDLAYTFCDHEIDKFASYLLKDILFMSASLKYVYVRANDSSVIVPLSALHGEQVSLIEHLTIYDIYIDLEQLYSIAPALRMLDAKLITYHPAHKFLINPPENLKQLSLKVSHLYFSTIEQLLHPMRRLVYLVIIANNVYNDMGDGAAWERILTRIDSFKFSFSFHKSTWTQEPISLDSFQSLFWLEKRQWYVGYDRCIVSGFSLLYSIPYFMDIYPWHAMKGAIDTKSTGPQLLSLNNINHFTISKQFPIDNERLYRLMNIQKLHIDDSERNFRVLLYGIAPYINMSRITTLFIAECNPKINIHSFVQFVSTMPHLSSLSVSIVLLKSLFVSHWSNIRRLEILLSWPTATTTESSLTSNEIDAFYRSFTHLESLSFHQDVDLNASNLLNNLPITTTNIVIHHPYKITPASFHDFITPDWLEQNTRLRHFSYSCNDLNTVSLWL